MNIEYCTKQKEFRPYRIIIETDFDSDNLSWIMKFLNSTSDKIPMENRYKKFIEKINNQLDKLGIPYTYGTK